MPSDVNLIIDGNEVWMRDGATVAAAIMQRKSGCRRSVKGDLRGPVCGMGICFECRATIDGKRQQRTCQILCKPGMVVRTDD